MLQFFLIRHACVDSFEGRIHGRSPGVYLNRQGKLDAYALARRLADVGIAAIYSSPRERAQQTAHALTQHLEIPTTLDEDLDELDYGGWTGRTISELQNSPEWRQFNACREKARIPGGESLADTARRTERALRRGAKAHGEGTVAFVTHADWIRTAVSSSLGIPFAAVLKFSIPTSSVTILALDNLDFRLLAWNESGFSATFRHY